MRLPIPMRRVRQHGALHLSDHAVNSLGVVFMQATAQARRWSCNPSFSVNAHCLFSPAAENARQMRTPTVSCISRTVHPHRRLAASARAPSAHLPATAQVVWRGERSRLVARAPAVDGPRSRHLLAFEPKRFRTGTAPTRPTSGFLESVRRFGWVRTLARSGGTRDRGKRVVAHRPAAPNETAALPRHSRYLRGLAHSSGARPLRAGHPSLVAPRSSP